MLKAEDIDFPLDAVMELQETYPQEVLDSEWNPVIAQLQLLKRRERGQEQNGGLVLFAVPDQDMPDPKA